MNPERPRRNRKTFNIPDCTCGEDHDSIGHITYAVLAALTQGAFDDAPDPLVAASFAVEEAAAQVGWVKAADELDDLRALVNRKAGE